MMSLDEIEATWNHKAAMEVLRKRPQAVHGPSYDPMCNPAAALETLCKRFGVTRAEDIAVKVNYHYPQADEPSSSAMFAIQNSEVAPSDITALFNPDDFDRLHLLPIEHPALLICKKFINEAYHFKYNAMDKNYHAVYVLCLFADNLYNQNNVDWCMTVFKLPEGSESAYACECVRFEDLWAINKTIIIDCYERKEAGMFHFTIPLPDQSDYSESDQSDNDYDGDMEGEDESDDGAFEIGEETAEETETSFAEESDASAVME